VGGSAGYRAEGLDKDAKGTCGITSGIARGTFVESIGSKFKRSFFSIFLR
jgi:hypothetical protein